MRIDGQEEHIITEEERIFEQVFKSNFKNLYRHAYTLVKDGDASKEIVQQVFFRLWQKKTILSPHQPVTAYLYKAVHNESLNYLKHIEVKAAHRSNTLYISEKAAPVNERASTMELEKKITEILLELPEKCRMVFQLSRYEELKYSEIADKLGISVKAVEKHITKALQVFRVKLKDYILLFIAFWITR